MAPVVQLVRKSENFLAICLLKGKRGTVDDAEHSVTGLLYSLRTGRPGLERVYNLQPSTVHGVSTNPRKTRPLWLGLSTNLQTTRPVDQPPQVPVTGPTCTAAAIPAACRNLTQPGRDSKGPWWLQVPPKSVPDKLPPHFQLGVPSGCDMQRTNWLNMACTACSA